ncbi:MAG: hypothetical protein AAGI90_01610 [Chlamydiota bacterium]
MITLLKKLFFRNWQRKLLALILAMIIWIVVNHYMSLSTTVRNVSVRVKNIPQGKTIEGIQSNGILHQKIAIHLTGNKDLIESLQSKDLEVVVDAQNTAGPWEASIGKKNLFLRNKRVDSRSVREVSAPPISLITSPMITEKVPIFVSKPIGEPPKGYAFLDVLPYKLFVNVTGSESEMKKLKKEGLKLTFNLDLISRDDLDLLYDQHRNAKHSIGDAISYLIPDSLKKIYIPSLSKYPFEIDDVHAKQLRINFVKRELIRIPYPIPISFFFSHKLAREDSAQNYRVKPNHFVQIKNGISMIKQPLYAKGISPLFAEITKDMIQIVISITPNGKTLGWNVQVMNPHQLENLFVQEKLRQSESAICLHGYPGYREEYFRNRFRKYVNQLRLFTANNEKLSLDLELEGREIVIQPINTL